MKKLATLLLLSLFAALSTTGQAALDSLHSIQSFGDGGLFYMEYTLDYRLEEILERGVGDDLAYAALISSTVMDGRPLPIIAVDAGCSSFTGRMEDGAYLMGRNFDLASPALPMVIRITPASGYASLSIADLGFVGFTIEERYTALCAPFLTMDGINEKGLCVSVLRLPGRPTRQDTGKKKIVTLLAVRMLLDQAATVDEAITLLEGYDMCSSGNDKSYQFMIADASGRTVVVSYPQNKMAVTEAAAATNFFLPNGSGTGKDRYRTIRAKQRTTEGAWSEQEAMALLKRVSLHANAKGGSLTRWSVVYNLEALTASILIPSNDEIVYRFALKRTR
ncbi:MAG: linear amide C-N hydrolase [Clostridia bacterium]|nr:linear amide C-N hydrolase [Clostridia bacterium]